MADIMDRVQLLLFYFHCCTKFKNYFIKAYTFSSRLTFQDHCYVKLKDLDLVFSDVRTHAISKTDFRTENQKGFSGNTTRS